MPQERVAIESNVSTERMQIIIQQLLAKLRRKVGLGVVQQRSNVILKRALAPALIIDEERPTVAQHDVARLKITIEKVVARGGEQEFRQAAEVIFQRLLVERNPGEPEEIIFEIIQIPRDGLPVKASNRIADLIVQIAAGLDLESRKQRDDSAICFDHLRCNVFSGAVFREELKKGRVAQIFLEIGARVHALLINFRHRETMAPEMLGKLEKRNIFFAHTI